MLAGLSGMISLVIAALAFVVAFVALAIQAWDKFLAEPDIWPASTWIGHSGGFVLSFTLVNTGFRQGVVEGVFLTSDLAPVGEKQQWTKASFVAALPAVLPPDSASAPFRVEMMDAESPAEIVAALRGGIDPRVEILLEIVDREASDAEDLIDARYELRFPTPDPFGSRSRSPRRRRSQPGLIGRAFIWFLRRMW
jgi:hypothetical protein